MEEKEITEIAAKAAAEVVEKLGAVDRKLTPGEGEEVKVTQNPEDRKFKSFGEQLRAVLMAGTNGEIDPRLKAPTGLSEGTDSEGGFLVQTDFATILLEKVFEASPIISRVNRIPISANSNGLKIPAIDETSRADGSRQGGIRAYWKGEAVSKTASQSTYKQVSLELKKLTGLLYATDELLQDTTALEAWIKMAFTKEFDFKIADAIINGTGVGQPLGILNAACLVTISKETNQASTTILAENIINMWARMYTGSRKNAIWLINQDIEPQLYTMSLAVGTGGIPVYMPAGGLSGQPYGTLFGRQVVPIEHAATLGAVGDIILADFSQYILIDKGGMQTATSIHVKFVDDETAFRFVMRLDGQPWWASSLAPYKGAGNTQSPFVVIEGR